MRLTSSWITADDRALVEMLREPDQVDDLLVWETMLALSGEDPVCVYDEKDYNVLEWALANDYRKTFGTLLESLMEHARETPGDIGLILTMLHEVRGFTTTCDMQEENQRIVGATRELIEIRRPGQFSDLPPSP